MLMVRCPFLRNCVPGRRENPATFSRLPRLLVNLPGLLNALVRAGGVSGISEDFGFTQLPVISMEECLTAFVDVNQQSSTFSQAINSHIGGDRGCEKEQYVVRRLTSEWTIRQDHVCKAGERHQAGDGQ